MVINHGGTMDLLYFRIAKKLSKIGGQAYLDFLKHQVHVVPEDLVKACSDKAREMSKEFKTNAEIHRTFFDKIPFESMWVEMLGGGFDLTSQIKATAFSLTELEPNRYYAIWLLTNIGDFKLYMDCGREAEDGPSGAILEFNERSVELGGDQTLAPLLLSFCLYAVGAITHREYQYGTARISRLLRGSVRPFDVTYIRSKRKIYTASENPHVPQNITWHHSWRVSGCWVRVKGIGKNRQGERVVKGLTWRVPHVKGSGPLKEKLRVMVASGKSEDSAEKDLQVDSELGSGV